MKRVCSCALSAVCAVGAMVVCSAASAAGSNSAIAAPIKTVHVTWGTIGYRAVGRGRPLVLVVGGKASIDDWAPSFIDLLARHHLVFALDNEGVGRTTLRPGKLTIPRWGDDVSDFIAALHLKRPDVLGWSTGGQVVEALAVRHPGSVRRIILCATGPGDGSALVSPIPQRASPPFANFFPADQDPARVAFIRDIHRYRHFYMAPAAVAQLQQTATHDWGTGQEAAGHHLNDIRAPALIADGSEDPYDAVANSRALAAQIPHSQLHIYSDAAHGFWFQDRVDFVRRIDRFLR
jgi:pimeloyl-ACP methyl ester carboxylesterase